MSDTPVKQGVVVGTRFFGNVVEIPSDLLDKDISLLALVYQLVYSLVGLFLGALCVPAGVLMIINGITGSGAGWSVEFIGIHINDAHPGILLFFVGLAAARLTQFSVRTARRHISLWEALWKGTVVEVPSDQVDNKFWKTAMKYQFIYSMIGLVLGSLYVIGGALLLVHGITTDACGWTAQFMGMKINDAEPGIVLFLVGLAMVRATAFSIQLAKSLTDKQP